MSHWFVYIMSNNSHTLDEYVGEQKAAIEREQQIKRWSRAKKVALIEQSNPNWIDLSRRVSLTSVLSS